MERAKHAFGSRKNLDNAISSNLVDAFDLLFLDGEDETPAIGWLDRDGNPVILTPADDLAEVETRLESELANKASTEEVQAVEAAIATKADAEKVEALESELATKVTAEEVEAKVGKYVSRMYEIAKAPDGTLVDYFDKEIRIMVPSTTDFGNLNNGIAGAENMRYIECHVYAPEGAVKYRFNFGGTVGEGNVEDFANCTDEHGRVYIATAPIIAYYDAGAAAWVYYGANSTTKHYIGWNHTAEWFDENDVVIASDCVRINLSNENCHYAVEPYYVGEMMTEVDAKIEKKLAELDSAYEIIEF